MGPLAPNLLRKELSDHFSSRSQEQDSHPRPPHHHLPPSPPTPRTTIDDSFQIVLRNLDHRRDAAFSSLTEDSHDSPVDGEALAINMESRKRRKSNKGQDMISNLPDFIIGRILSLLPTKDAVRTSVLSKNWTYKWTFITDLHFEDKGRYSNRIVRRSLFLSFVHRVLLYLNSSSIQSFSLTISEKYEPCHVDHWISAVVSRRVKKLCIYSKKEQAFSSHSLMKYKSLEELVLNVYHCEIGFPTFALFSSLTVLNLSGIQFSDISSNKSGKVHLNFPVLRTYKTNNCSWSSSLNTYCFC
ncbi:F-box/FBD/LRR-repeat protein At3g14710-like [Lotus japonicus]|uniref:F-box/FBD/LRR-repeat protein At3g14710-like n=1 Tax=Lotus japonicus TaxID=34305 RepID=UPI0025908D7A|nr:F-box/FBD/LRR-repeat protein At3g14710-like [Lotus japonicus]